MVHTRTAHRRYLALLANLMDKHAALNHTAKELTKHGLAFIAAKNLHK